jgi:sugar-specific transcriptional regulator TrmB
MELSMEEPGGLVKIYDEKNEVWKFVKKDRGLNKQLMMVEDTLSRFGLLKNEIRVYVYLARVGEKKAGEIAEAIALHRTETYRILRDLEKRGIVFSAFHKPLKFTAVPLEKAIDLLIDVQKMKIMLLEKEKAGLVDLWRSLPQPKVENHRKEIFQILEGGQQLILKAKELLEITKDEIQIFAPGEYLAQLYHSDFMDNLKRHAGKFNITLLTDNSLKSRFFISKMNWTNDKCRVVDVKNIPCFIISDRSELLIAVQETGETENTLDKKKAKMVALWTNYSAFVEALLMLFSKLHEAGKKFEEIQLKVSDKLFESTP